MASNKETRNLKLHPMAIYTFIKAQAGTLAKALSESVMNSLDAFSTQVNITLTETGYVIEDDGMGFNSTQEIYSWFETLGWPHDELPGNHRQFGKFGLGRAQQWAYASNVWHSNGFLMTVDIQKKGLDYELTEVAPRKGTKITGTFYKPLDFAAIQRVERELRDLVRYVTPMVTFNGAIINKDPALEEWTFVTDDAYVLVDQKSHQASIYNGGILVGHFQKHRFDFAGVVVTKPNAMLQLNVARNEILEAECESWPRIRKTLPKMEDRTSSKVKKLTAKEQRVLAERLVNQVKSGVLSLADAMMELPTLVTTVLGRSVPYYDLGRAGRYSPVVFVPKGDEFGKRLSQLRRALVLSAETLELWGCKTPEEFRELLIEQGQQDHGRRFDATAMRAHAWTCDAKALFPSMAAERIELPVRKLTPREKAVCIALSSNARYLTKDLLPLLEAAGITLRKHGHYLPIEFGDSPANIAWLSDTGLLVIRKADAVREMEGGTSRLLTHIVACLREALLDRLGERTDELLMKFFVTTNALGFFTLNAMGRFVSECQKRDLALPEKHLLDLGNAGVASGEEGGSQPTTAEVVELNRAAA